MSDFIANNKGLALIALILVVGLGYYVFTSTTSPSNELLTESTTSSDTSHQLLATLDTVRTITLSTEVFQDPVYQSLTDFGVVIPQQPLGRRNPFVPFFAAPAAGGTTLPTSQD